MLRRQLVLRSIRVHPSHFSRRLVQSSASSTEATPKPRSPYRYLRWAAALGVSYGTFVVLTHHYSSERRFDRIRTHVRKFAKDTLHPKWKSIGDVEKSLVDEEDGPYHPPIVQVIRERQDEATGWSQRTLNFLKSPLSFSKLSDSIPSWEWPESLMNIRYQLSLLLLELGRGEGSLWSEVVNGTPDPEAHPEVQWDAEVRIGDDLCFSEKAFLRERKRRMLHSFSKILDVPESALDERDLPIVAIAASGGGFRAMCNTAGVLRAAQRTGILDVTTYISAISGSCWTLGALYSGVAGDYTAAAAANHLQRRVQLPYLDSHIMDMLITKPTNKYLLSGLIQKAVGPHGYLSLVDIYGTLISARLFCPEDLSRLNPAFISPSHFRVPVDNASLPMPIFTAISRYMSNYEGNVAGDQTLVVDADRAETLAVEKEAAAKRYSTWLWYEFSPYEVGCDELGAWIPAWALGREFSEGKSLQRTPELSFTILAGIYASAFCASLQLYFKEARPIVQQLPTAIFSWIDSIVNEREQDFDVMHPVPPNRLPSFVRGLDGHLRQGSPENIGQMETIGLMDAGAELNIPYYPLLRRDVDCIIALDASADSQDLWFTRAEAYAARKGLMSWPRGVKWPVEIMSTKQSVEDKENANVKLAEAAETEVAVQADKQHSTDSDTDSEVPTLSPAHSSDGPSSAYVWIGSSKDDHSSPAAPIDVFDEEILSARDGIGIIYMPLIPNQRAAPGMDPYDVSTWSFELSLDQSSKLMDVADANFTDGTHKIKAILRAMWLRKKRAREAAEGHSTSPPTHLPSIHLSPVPSPPWKHASQ